MKMFNRKFRAGLSNLYACVGCSSRNESSLYRAKVMDEVYSLERPAAGPTMADISRTLHPIGSLLKYSVIHSAFLLSNLNGSDTGEK